MTAAGGRPPDRIRTGAAAEPGYYTRRYAVAVMARRYALILGGC